MIAQNSLEQGQNWSKILCMVEFIKSSTVAKFQRANASHYGAINVRNL